MSEPNSYFYNENPLWGIGMCVRKDGEAVYGYPWKGMNPEDFSPDPECCNPQEIFNWKLSKKFKVQCSYTKRLYDENKKLKGVISDQDRVRGYPTGSEWSKIVKTFKGRK